jgi:hypothetical protein
MDQSKRHVAKLSNISPLVSLVIVTFNRCDELRSSLDKFASQTYRSTEVIIVDDGSQDGTRAMLEQLDNVKAILLDKNVGLVEARNIGQAVARGDYILTLDDDSWLVDDFGVQQIVDTMMVNPRIGVLALNIKSRGFDYTWKCEEESFSVAYYTGCGNVYRADVLRRIGGYIKEFVRQGEELERSMRVYRAGYVIAAAPSIRVFHDVSPSNRDPTMANRLNVRNAFLREALNAPLIFVIPSWAKSFASGIKLIGFASTLKQFTSLFSQKELKDVVFLRREPMRITQYILWHRLRRRRSPMSQLNTVLGPK